MNRTIDFELNEFPSVPHLLRVTPADDVAETEFIIDLARLYHHYHLDSYGITPPDPDHTNFEYLRFLSNSQDFRLLSQRVATSSAHKRTVSFKLGQAFCRYFLYEFCGITYFAHMDKVVNKKTHPAFNGLQVKRIMKGDVPDYLCAKSINNPLIAEAKGAFSTIRFNSESFKKWRSQFTRISVLDRYNVPKKVKGYIVATSLATETTRYKSKVLAEDPETVGEEMLKENDFGLGRGCMAIHYSRLLYRLGLNILAQSLEDGFVVPDYLIYNLPLWKCNHPALKDKLFVGGFLGEAQPHMQKLENEHFIFYPNILRLGNPSPSFFGIEVEIFRSLRRICAGNWDLFSEIAELPDTDFRPSNLAWLRDGAITGSLDYFELIGTEAF